MGSNLRIVILNKTSALMTERYGMQFYAPIHTRHSWKAAIEQGKASIRSQIGEYRNALRFVMNKDIHSQPGHFIRELERRREALILEEKKPLTAQRHVGVEIEFLSSWDRTAIRRELTKAGLAAYCNLTSDGSVEDDCGSEDCDGSCRDNCECSHVDEFHHDSHADCQRYERNTGQGEPWVIDEDCDECEPEELDDCDCGGADDDGTKHCDGHVACVGHCPGHTYDPDFECTCECTCGGAAGHELRVIAPQVDIKGVIQRCMTVLNETCGARINSTCGLHVHLDMRARDYKRAFYNLVRSQELLYSLVPQSRKRNTYCAPTDGADFESMQGTGRYKGINPESYKEHRTIEVRIHSGTTSAVKINHWIDLLVRIATSKRYSHNVATIAELREVTRVTPELIEYMKKRIEKFSGVNRRYVEEAA